MKKTVILSSILLLLWTGIIAQTHPDFTLKYQIKTSDVKNQANSGTCWSYATISFLETELLRKGKESVDLSEMFYVRYAYLQKAIYYVRLHGLGNFSQGGQAHDVTNVLKTFGMVPQEIYNGLHYGENFNAHSEMEMLLKGMLDEVVKNHNQKLSTTWLTAFTAALDSYLGAVPQSFEYKNKKYSPATFASDYLNLNATDYIELTSYNHHPFYTKFDLEIPDNWSHDVYYNIPINELMLVIDNALQNGYSVCWDGDVSEKGFNHKAGTAELITVDTDAIKSTDMQKYRQITFDNYTTTDDHLMHITGLATNKNGEKYYLTKNSWGTESNSCNGYLYMSENYTALKAIAIMVHKDAIPKEILKKLNIN